MGAPKRIIGLSYEKRRDTYSAYGCIRAMAVTDSRKYQTCVVHTEKRSTDWQGLVEERDAAMLWLTDGRCAHMTGYPVVAKPPTSHSSQVLAFREQVLGCNADEDMCLMKSGWMEALGKHKLAAKPSTRLRKPISFQGHMLQPMASTSVPNPATSQPETLSLEAF